MKIPKECYLVKPLEVVLGSSIKGEIIDKGNNYTRDGEEWKKTLEDPDMPKVGDTVLYSIEPYGKCDVLIQGKLHHIINSVILIL